jgi:hypothetical protein
VPIKLPFYILSFSCFRHTLNKKQYEHLQALAFALHLAEARNVDDEMVKKIDMLLKYFNQEFEHLYTVNISLIIKSRLFL